MNTRILVLFILLLSIALTSGAATTAEPPCATDEDCLDLYYCKPDPDAPGQSYCQHKPLFPLTVREIITLVLLMLVAGPAHGLGAGSIMSPIILIGMNYEASKVTMIMQALILGGSTGAFLNSFWRRNPKTGKPVIDYDVSMVIMPIILLGVAIGVTIKLAAPQIVIIAAILTIEITTMRKLIVKAKEQHAREQNAAKPAALPLVAPVVEEPPKIEGSEGVEGLGGIEMKDFKANEAVQRELQHDQQANENLLARPADDGNLQSILAEDKRLFPPTKLFWVFTLLGWIVFMTIMRSGRVLEVSYCSFRYWGLFAGQLLGCFLLYLRNKSAVSNRIEVKRSHGISSEADFLLRPNVLINLGKAGIIAGICAGFLGIGAGVLMGPPLMNQGCPPGVFGPTMAFGIVQSAFIASAVSLLLYNNLNFTELGVFFAAAVLGSYFVNRMISFMVGKYQKPSISLWVTISIVGSSILIIPAFTVWKSIEEPAQMLKYRWIC